MTGLHHNKGSILMFKVTQKVRFLLPVRNCQKLSEKLQIFTEDRSTDQISSTNSSNFSNSSNCSNSSNSNTKSYIKTENKVRN